MIGQAKIGNQHLRSTGSTALLMKADRLIK